MIAAGLPTAEPVAETIADGAVALLAVIQGLTEFLPISSSGHLVLAQTALGLTEGGLALDVALHVGTLAAVLWVYRGAVAEVLREAASGRPRELLLILAGSLPAGLVGIVFGDVLEGLFHAPRAAGGGLLATAAILLWGERSRRRAAVAEPTGREPTLADALWIGAGQALAILPGISRSGTTIALGMVRGLSPERSARLSFLLAIPAIGGAALLHLPGARETGAGGVAPATLWMGAALAALVGWGALTLLLASLRRGAFRWFAAYCAILGAAVLAFV